jgi:multisubunit Na+/H+ antiporter MnhG subunit
MIIMRTIMAEALILMSMLLTLIAYTINLIEVLKADYKNRLHTVTILRIIGIFIFPLAIFIGVIHYIDLYEKSTKKKSTT